MAKKVAVVESKEVEDVLKIYVDEELERSKVLNNPVQWDSYSDAYVSSAEMELLKKYDKKSANKSELWQKSGQDLARILMVFLAKLSKEDDLKYLLTLIDDSIKKSDVVDAPDAVKNFERLRKSEPINGVPKLPFGPLTAILGRKQHDFYIIGKTCSIMNQFILNFSHVDSDTVETFMHWLIEQLNSVAFEGDARERRDEERRLSIVLVALRNLLSINKYRHLFVEEDGLIPLVNLSNLDEEKINFQRLYETTYVLWLVSFHTKARSKMTDQKLIANLVHIIKRATKDKVIRVAIATLKNLVNVGKNNEYMIFYSLHKTLEILLQKKFGDEELEEDIKELSEIMTENMNELSTFDKYKYEVESGKLEWSPPHKSEKFWTENYLRFEESEYSLLRILKDIIENGKDKKIISIACWDIGEFVRFHPRGKKIVQLLEIKFPIMKLLNHADENVRKEALVALQKLMVTNWEYLQ